MNLSRKSILIGAISLGVVWHIVVAMTAHVSLAGPFQSKPAPGYSWVDTVDGDPRFFWQNAPVKWQAGLKHPEFNVETSSQANIWTPLPGYVFVDQSQGLNTVWKKGLLHPDYKAWSDEVEGQWIPVTGYKFVYQGNTFVDSVWDPNKRYDDLKVISLSEKDHYKPFPGYTFIDPNQSLNVVWTPGTVNSDNPRLVAGRSEGTWEINGGQSPARRMSSGKGSKIGTFAAGVGAGILIDRVLLK